MLANALCVCLASVVVGASALTLRLAEPRDSDPPADVTSSSASIYFEIEQAVVDEEATRSIAEIAKAARISRRPVAIVPFAARPGSRDQRPGLAHMRATRVREALVRAGIARTRIIIVSPTFVSSDLERVEVSLVPGVRVLPARAGTQPSLSPVAFR